MDTIIEKEIYKKLSQIMTQDMGCECEVTKVYKNPEHIRDTVATYKSVPYIEFNMSGINRKESGNYADMMYNFCKELYEKYKKGDSMKVMFVSEKYYKVFNAWYNYMDVVKKHRKIIIACDSPLDFCHKFDESKMGAAYTTFYFDKELTPLEIHNCIMELKYHYNDETFEYIVENKLRTISVADMIETNDMSKFEELHIDDLKIKVGDIEVKNEKTANITIEEYDHIGMELLHMTRRIDDLSANIQALEKQVNIYKKAEKVRKDFYDIDLENIQKRVKELEAAVNNIYHYV